MPRLSRWRRWRARSMLIDRHGARAGIGPLANLDPHQRAEHDHVIVGERESQPEGGIEGLGARGQPCAPDIRRLHLPARGTGLHHRRHGQGQAGPRADHLQLNTRKTAHRGRSQSPAPFSCQPSPDAANPAQRPQPGHPTPSAALSPTPRLLALGIEFTQGRRFSYPRDIA